MKHPLRDKPSSSRTGGSFRSSPTDNHRFPRITKLCRPAAAFAVPGLIDAHVHLATDPNGRDRNAYERLQGALRGGVTSVRDMAGDASVLRKLADSTHPTAPIPRIYYSAVIAGPTFFQDPRTKSSAGSYTPGEAPWLKAVSEESAIRDAVEQAKSSGATGIKLYADLPASLIPALVRVAHSQDMKVWAHATVFPARPEYPRTP